MSSELGVDFGSKHHEKYSEVVESWSTKLAGKEITKNLFEEWGKDLHEALAEDLFKSLMDNPSFSKANVDLPSKETLERFSQIAVKYSLQYATRDLLSRLIRSSDFEKENPPEEGITAAIRPMRPSELAKRSPQTVAQIFDMAKDRFSAVLSRFLTKNEQFTGRRRWVTVGRNSRHASLHHEVKGPEAFFSYKGEEIAAPRPVGGSPANWSNCSCYLEYEKKNGGWVSAL